MIAEVLPLVARVVRRLCRQLRLPLHLWDDAQGVAHVALVRAAASYPADSPPCPWPAYALRRVTMRVRSMPYQRRYQSLRRALHCGEPLDSPHARLDARRDVSRLLSTPSLTAREREALVAVYLEGLTPSELARRAGYHRSRASALVASAVMKLRVRTHTPALPAGQPDPGVC